MAPAAAGEMARIAPARMPRLAYRNPLPADQTSLSSAHTSSSDTPSNEAVADLRLLTPSTTATSSPVHPTFDSRPSSRTATTASLASNASISQDPKASKKKKKTNGVLGFLALKEPSQSALEQFAEQQRKLASEKGSAGNPVALGSVSPQKLPTSVPKVNSKWDGVPESLKFKDRDSIHSKRKSTTSSKAPSSFSFTPTGSTLRNGSILSTSSDGSSRNPPNSIVSTANSSSLEFSDLSNLSQTPSLGPRRDSGPSVTTQEKSDPSVNSPLPEMSYFFPDNSNPSGNLSQSSEDPMHRGKQPIPSPPTSDTTVSKSFLDVEPNEPSCLGALPVPSNPRLSAFLSLSDESSTAGSPPDGSIDIADLIDTEAIFSRLSNNRAFMAGEAQALAVLPVPASHSFLIDDAEVSPFPAVGESSSDDDSDDDFVLPTIDGDGLGRPLTMNFSRPMSAQSAPLVLDLVSDPSPTIILPGSRRTMTGLPTLYEASIEASIASSVTVNEELTESDKTESRRSMDTVSLAESFAPSIAPSVATSITPSVMSASWYQSPRERLGLGGRIRKSDVTPWESNGELAPGEPKSKRGSGLRRSLFAKSTA